MKKHKYQETKFLLFSSKFVNYLCVRDFQIQRPVSDAFNFQYTTTRYCKALWSLHKNYYFFTHHQFVYHSKKEYQVKK